MVAVSIAGQALEFEIYVVYKWRGQDNKPLVVDTCLPLETIINLQNRKAKYNCDRVKPAQCSALESAIALRLQLKSEVWNRQYASRRQISLYAVKWTRLNSYRQ